MRYLFSFLIILITTLVLQFVLPWWVIILVPFAVCLWRVPQAGAAFLLSLIAVAVGWLGYALYIDQQTQGSMSGRMAELFGLPGSASLLWLVVLLGGLVGGIAGLAGSYVRQLLNGEHAVSKA